MSRQSLCIAMLTHSTNPRGGVVHVLELADALVKRGHAVTVLAPALPGKSFFRMTAATTELIPVTDAPGGLAALVKGRVEAIVDHLGPRAADFDILHAHDGMTGFALARLKDAGALSRFVRTVHHLDIFEDAYLAHAQHQSVADASTVLCVSQLWADRVHAEFATPAHVVTNGVDPARFHPGAGHADEANLAEILSPSDSPLFLCIGGVEARKNMVGALRAFLAARSALPPNATLLIVGGASLLDHSTYRREFDSILAGAGNPSAVRVIGTVADSVLPAIYRRADVLFFPSLVEGFGLATLEAMASGTPVITSRIPPFTEYLSDRDALLVDPNDIPEMSAALIRSLDPRVRIPLIAAGRIVAARFPWSLSAEIHERHYQTSLTLAGDMHARDALRYTLAR